MNDKGMLLVLVGLCMLSFGVCVKALVAVADVESATSEFKSTSTQFAIDSVNYHAPGKDNTLQVSPYWKCHLKGTNVWVRVNENREIGDSLSMMVKTYK
jgi:hypothetical protein